MFTVQALVFPSAVSCARHPRLSTARVPDTPQAASIVARRGSVPPPVSRVTAEARSTVSAVADPASTPFVNQAVNPPKQQQSQTRKVNHMKPTTKTLMAIAILAAVPFSTAHAQSMSGADKQAMIENFLQADTNNDGALYRSEFETLMKLNAQDNLGRASMVVRAGAYGKAFDRLDKNGDGAVTKEEIQALADTRG